jgi:dolichol-phosphate mannosyltransferase
VTISLVVPCYQEEDALGAFAELLPGLAVEEAIFVDDGSTDGTAARIEALAAADPRARLVSHASNRGVGAAMRTGLEAAEGDVVVVYDADCTYPSTDIARLVAEVEAGADVATASPWMVEGSGDRVPFGRRVLSRGAALAYRAVLGPHAGRLATFTCAFRAYGAALLERLSFDADGFGAAAEILGRSLLMGAVVVEVPSVLTERASGTSKMRVAAALGEHLGVLSRLWRARTHPRRMTLR